MSKHIQVHRGPEKAGPISEEMRAVLFEDDKSNKCQQSLENDKESLVFCDIILKLHQSRKEPLTNIEVDKVGLTGKGPYSDLNDVFRTFAKHRKKPQPFNLMLEPVNIQCRAAAHHV